MRTVKQIIIRHIIPPIGYLFIYILCATCKRDIVNRNIESEALDKNLTPAYTFWHGRILYFPFLYRGQNRHHILVSPSHDGEIIGNTLKLFGFSIIWGSTFKQAAKALLKLVRKVKSNKSVVLIADGSRGPLYTVHQGTIGIAHLTGAPIIPMTYSARRKKIFRSWDKFILPYPFTRIVVIYGAPVYVPRGIDRKQLEIKRLELENELKKITHQADTFYN